jgi:hypothetical protein
MKVLKCELTARDLVRRSNIDRKKRSVGMKTSFIKPIGGKVYYLVDSQTRPGKRHVVVLTSPSMKDDISLEELKEIMKKEDIKVSCSCEDFLYKGYRYMTYHANAGIDPEDRPPIRRNPAQLGMLCKHILAVLRHLGVRF